MQSYLIAGFDQLTYGRPNVSIADDVVKCGCATLFNSILNSIVQAIALLRLLYVGGMCQGSQSVVGLPFRRRKRYPRTAEKLESE